MNFSAVEDSPVQSKQKYSNFLSRFYANFRILIIILSFVVIAAISIFIWFQSSDYAVLYDHLSNERQVEVVNQLNQMRVPYQIIADSDQLLVPSDKINNLRLYFSQKNFFNSNDVGFELLDKEKFGISQFNEKINYQRALEGELARTVQKINSINSAKIHIALPESSLFLQDKKAPSASVILNVKSEKLLNSNQINAILHFIASSISDLSTKNITIVDQFGRLLNNSSLEYIDSNNLQFNYAKGIEEHYKTRIQNILEPLVGKGNVYSQVTAQVDFNAQDSTEEQYAPNAKKNNQSMRSRQISIHDKIDNDNISQNIPNALSNSIDDIHSIKNTQNHTLIKKDILIKNNNLHDFPKDEKSDINHENTVNYELNHIISHTKQNIGEIKRLSAAVVVNLRKSKNGTLITLSKNEIHNIKYLVREAIGYSKIRGDSLYVVNTAFAPHHIDVPVRINHSESFRWSDIVFFMILFFSTILFIGFLLCRYARPISQNSRQEIEEIQEHQKDDVNNQKNESDILPDNFQKDLNIDQLIHQIGNISNQNPRTIALIIRQWMSNKI